MKAENGTIESVMDLIGIVDIKECSLIVNEMFKKALETETYDDAKYRSNVIHHIEEILNFLSRLNEIENELKIDLYKTLLISVKSNKN